MIFIFVSLLICVGAVSAENSTDISVQDQVSEDVTPVGEVQNTTSDNQVPAATKPVATKQSKSVKKIDTDADADDVVVDYNLLARNTL